MIVDLYNLQLCIIITFVNSSYKQVIYILNVYSFLTMKYYLYYILFLEKFESTHLKKLKCYVKKTSNVAL